jgi:hypothetical protein
VAKFAGIGGQDGGVELAQPNIINKDSSCITQLSSKRSEKLTAIRQDSQISRQNYQRLISEPATEKS